MEYSQEVGQGRLYYSLDYNPVVQIDERSAGFKPRKLEKTVVSSCRSGYPSRSNCDSVVRTNHHFSYKWTL